NPLFSPSMPHTDDPRTAAPALQLLRSHHEHADVRRRPPQHQVRLHRVRDDPIRGDGTQAKPNERGQLHAEVGPPRQSLHWRETDILGFSRVAMAKAPINKGVRTSHGGFGAIGQSTHSTVNANLPYHALPPEKQDAVSRTV